MLFYWIELDKEIVLRKQGNASLVVGTMTPEGTDVGRYPGHYGFAMITVSLLHDSEVVLLCQPQGPPHLNMLFSTISGKKRLPVPCGTGKVVIERHLRIRESTPRVPREGAGNILKFAAVAAATATATATAATAAGAALGRIGLLPLG